MSNLFLEMYKCMSSREKIILVISFGFVAILIFFVSHNSRYPPKNPIEQSIEKLITLEK